VGVGVEAVISDSESFGKPKLSGNPRGYVPLVAGRSLRKGGRERSDRWKGETRSGFPLQGDLAFTREIFSGRREQLLYRKKILRRVLADLIKEGELQTFNIRNWGMSIVI